MRERAYAVYNTEAVATRITFGFEIARTLGCAELAVDAALCLAPPLRWLYLVIDDLSKAMLLVELDTQ